MTAYRFRGLAVVVATLVFALPVLAGDEDLTPPLSFTAVVKLEGGRIPGSRQLAVQLCVNHLTPRENVWARIDRVAAAGQDGLRAVLEGRSDGVLRLGAVDFPINLAVYRRDGGKHTFLLVSARALKVAEVNFGMDSVGYPFGVAYFSVDSLGRGEGLVYPAARITLNEAGGVVIESYLEDPGTLAEVRLQR